MKAFLALLMQLALAWRAQAQAGWPGAPCRATDYNVVGLLRLSSHSDGCGDSIVTQCWPSLQVAECKEANRTRGTDGAISLWPLVPLAIDPPENDTVLCPSAVGNVVDDQAAGFIFLDGGDQELFTLVSSSVAHVMLLSVGPGQQCMYEYRLQMATSDVLRTAPEVYGRWSGAWSAAAGRGLLAAVAALAGVAALQMLQ